MKIASLHQASCFFAAILMALIIASAAVHASSEIENPEGQSSWIWQPIEGSMCRDGSMAGYFIQKNSDSTDLLIFIDGGGACFSSNTCANNDASIDKDFIPKNAGLVSSLDERNPVRDWNKVFIPYCTGDVMAGTKENVRISPRYNREQFVGYRNMGLFLDELTADFDKTIDRVILAGGSAGGLAAAYNFDRTQESFGEVPVHLLNDSGPLFADEYLAPCLQQQWRETWGLNDSLPVDCDDCLDENGGGIINYMNYLANKHRDRRFAFLSSKEDTVIRIFYGYGSNDCQTLIPFMTRRRFLSGLTDLRDRFLVDDRFTSLFVDGQYHGFLNYDRFFELSADGMTIYEWVSKFVESTAL